jgi:hypothetical protein
MRATRQQIKVDKIGQRKGFEALLTVIAAKGFPRDAAK